MAKEREQLQAELSVLKTTLNEKTDELSQILGDKTALQDNLNATLKELDAIKSSTMKESESSKVVQESLISRLDEANESLNEKSTENEALRVEIDDLKNQLSGTKESSALQEDELRTAIGNLEEVIRVRDQQYTELVGEKESLSEELVSAKSSNAISEEEVKSLKELLALRDEELAEESAEKQMMQQELDEVKKLAAEKKSRSTPGRSTARARTPIATTRQKSPATLGKSKGNGSMSKSETTSSRSKASLYGTMSFKSRTAPVGDVAVMFCFKPTDAQKKMVTALGGTLIESLEKAHEATHVIAGDGQKNSLRRTPKLMIGLCSTSNILHLDWLITSYKQKRFCESRQFLLLHDQTAESNYSFSMKETLRNGEERRSEGGLFTGRSIYFAKNVAGNKAPKAEELRMIIDAAGGKVVDSLSPDKDYYPNVFVITSDPLFHPDLVAAQEAEEYVSEVADVFPTSWLFDVIIHQKLSGLKRGRGF
uniref:BRCT domain-containing protein n=1 Tax=Leptocylindrus danicus TaxID=163516 RepID=A0A7S2NXA5_9STRA